MQGEETRAWLALALCASGRPDEWRALARDCGGATAVVQADDRRLAACGASRDAVSLLRDAWSRRSGPTLERCARLSVGVAAFGSPQYPDLLSRIADPPLVLFWKGEAPAGLEPALAVVGARRCTPYGERVASRIGADAASRGIVVVSGLARGVDAAAHRGALEAGRTAAVLAGGLDRVYPGEHCSLAARIVDAGGTLLSEQPPGVRPRPWLFPFRNRIITGLCEATIVVEAGRRSGSLASARHALDQGRDVFAVPGPIDSALSEGANGLLGDAASPFRSVADLRTVRAFSELIGENQRNDAETQEIRIRALDAEAAAVLGAVEAGRTTADEISAATTLDGTRVLTLLTALELDGLLDREALGRFRATRTGPRRSTRMVR